MKIKTSELTGRALDWAVNQANRDVLAPVEYSTKWEFGGPIIEREKIRVGPVNDSEGWFAYKYVGGGKPEYFGPTPLIAAMRCFVASKLGDEVEIPEELK